MTYSFKKHLIYFLLGFVFSSQTAFCSKPQFVFTRCGEESEEVLRIIDSFEKHGVQEKGMIELLHLSAQGDVQAFEIRARFYKEFLPKKYAVYIHDTRRILLQNENYDALARMGHVLCAMREDVKAYPFLKEAIKHKDKLSVPLEDVEYNYAALLFYVGGSIRTDQFNPFKESWEIIKKYLSRKESEFGALISNFLITIEKRNEEKLINEVGHYLLQNTSFYHDAFLLYHKIFKNTLHWERLLRQGNAFFIKDWNSSSKEHISNIHIFQHAIQKKIEMKNAFILGARQKIKDFVLHRLLTLREDKKIDPLFKRLGVSDFSSLTKFQHEEFARHLIYDHGPHLFSLQDDDVQEYLGDIDGGLYSKSERQKFLMDEIFPKLEEGQNKIFWEKSEDLVYNRIALLLRDDPEFSEQIAYLQKNLDVSSKEKIHTISTALLAENSSSFFPQNTDKKEEELSPLERFLTTLDDKEKQHLITSAVKKLLGEDD